MRAILALVLMLNAQPALACHHYRSWSYPWPQSCKVASAPAQPRRTWFVEIKPEPAPEPAAAIEDTNDQARESALDTLKEELRWHAAQSLTLEEKRNGD